MGKAPFTQFYIINIVRFGCQYSFGWHLKKSVKNMLKNMLKRYKKVTDTIAFCWKKRYIKNNIGK